MKTNLASGQSKAPSFGEMPFEVPFKVIGVMADGKTVTKFVDYPSGTSPRDVAVHQAARNGYKVTQVSRAYENPLGNTPFTFAYSMTVLDQFLATGTL